MQNINNTYTAKVTAGAEVTLEVIPAKANAKVEIIKEVTTAEGTTEESIVASSTGTFNNKVPLEQETQNYTIRITSADGEVSNDYSLTLTQKSQDTALEYVRVDGNDITEENGKYTALVSKKDEYPINIKALGETSKLKISYEGYDGAYGESQELAENISLAEGETLNITITVKSENGDTQDYALEVTRQNSNIGLEYVKVNSAVVTEYDETTKTYKIAVDNTLTESMAEAKAISEKAQVTINANTGNPASDTITLSGEGTEKTVTINVQAEDGSNETYYLKIIQLSAKTMLESITVNEKQAQTENSLDYFIEITSKEEIAKIVAKSKDVASKVIIKGYTKEDGEVVEDVAAQTQATQNRKLTGKEETKVEIKVVAEDRNKCTRLHINNKCIR